MEPKYETDLHLRLKPDERAYLQKRAEDFSCSLSQAARILMFDRDRETADDNRTLQKKEALALKGARNEFKRICGHYEAIVSTVVENPAVTSAAVIRALRSLENMTVSLQKTLNSVLDIMHEKQVHLVSKTYEKIGENTEINTPKNTPEKVIFDAEKLRDFRIKYCYMEKISIIGFLAADAQEYEKNASKKMRFPVLVERRKKGDKSRVIYNVFSKKSDILEYLKKGKQVYVDGTFSEDEKGEKVIFADNISLFGEA